MTRGDFVCGDSKAGRGAVGHTNAADRFARILVLDVHVDSRPGAPGNVEHGRARGVEADALDLDLRAWRSGRQRNPERRARDVSRDDELARAEPLPADDADALPGFRDGYAELVECALRMIARGHGLEHDRLAISLQAREEHGAT